MPLLSAMSALEAGPGLVALQLVLAVEPSRVFILRQLAEAKLKGSSAPSARAELLIGRNAAKCDIRIPVDDEALMNDGSVALLNVSRVHCRLVQDAQLAWWVHDNKSTNGVYVNGLRVQASVLAPGDTIVIGGGRNISLGESLKLPAPLALSLKVEVEQSADGRRKGRAGPEPALVDPSSVRAALAQLPPPVVAATAVRSCAPVVSQDAETQQQSEPQCALRGAQPHSQLAVADELQCAVCRYTLLEPHSLACSHSFCGLCLHEWFSHRRDVAAAKAAKLARRSKRRADRVNGPVFDCPVCRSSVGTKPILVRSLRAAVDAFSGAAPSVPGEERQERREEWLQVTASGRAALRKAGQTRAAEAAAAAKARAYDPFDDFDFVGGHDATGSSSTRGESPLANTAADDHAIESDGTEEKMRTGKRSREAAAQHQPSLRQFFPSSSSSPH